MKKICNFISILFVVVLFCVGLDDVKAWRETKEVPVLDTCVNNKTCELLCGYQEKVLRLEGSSGKVLDERYYNINIIYYYDNNLIKIIFDLPYKWNLNKNKVKTLELGISSVSSSGTLEYIRGIEDLYIQPEISDQNLSSLLDQLVQKGICPAYGYASTGSEFGDEEAVCFDDGKENFSYTSSSQNKSFTGSFCELSTAETRKSTTHFKASKSLAEANYSVRDITSEMNYNYNERIKRFADTLRTNFDIPVADIDKWVADVEGEYQKLLKKDLFYGFDVPQFFKGNDLYTEMLDIIKSKLDTAVNKEKERIAQEQEEIRNNPDLTAEEKEALLEELDEELIALEAKRASIAKQVADAEKALKDLEGLIGVGKIVCDDIFGSKFNDLLVSFLDFTRFLVPIVILIFSIIDFVKALASQENEAIKKAGNNLAKRLVIGIAIFLVETILIVFLEYFGISCNLIRR